MRSSLMYGSSRRVGRKAKPIMKSSIASWSVPRLPIAFNFASLFSTVSPTDQFLYKSTIDAEPLHRYRKGGYHPITLGSFLDNGRYKILHKLGWGGYSTVWAARDQRLYKWHCCLQFQLNPTNLLPEKGLTSPSRSPFLREEMRGTTESSMS